MPRRRLPLGEQRDNFVSMIAPAVLLALHLVQTPVACDWMVRPSGRFYVCVSPENTNIAVAFVCDGKSREIGRINFSIVTHKQGISGRMSVKNGGKEVQIPMLGVPSGLNGFASSAVPEAFGALKKLLETAKGPLSFEPIDTPGVAAVSIDGAAIENALQVARTACKGT